MTDVIGAQVMVGTTDTQIVPPTRNSQTVVGIRNRGSVSVFLGPVGDAAGFEVGAGEFASQGAFEIPPETTIDARAASGSQRVDVFRIVAD